MDRSGIGRLLPGAAAILAIFAIAAVATPNTITPDTIDKTRTGSIVMQAEQTATTHPYAGMWVTANRNIRHELLPNGRYVEARGNREKAYEGRYWLKGDHIEYLDDSGFSADGDFRDGVLYHAGMVMTRER
jgi:hypothetical protein